MTKPKTSLAPAYFEAIYRRDPDPWGFRTSAYEAEKYAATLASLSAPRYGSALEVGCSIGVFTRQLAVRCDALTAIDASEAALDVARQDCRDLTNVTFGLAVVPDQFPQAPYDLIVLSEVLYYLSPEDLARLAEQCMETTASEVVLCHWLGETNYPLTGDEAATSFMAATLKRWPAQRGVRRGSYRLDRLTLSERPFGLEDAQ